jgi:hypothetical protein
LEAFEKSLRASLRGIQLGHQHALAYVAATRAVIRTDGVEQQTLQLGCGVELFWNAAVGGPCDRIRFGVVAASLICSVIGIIVAD